MNQLIFTLDRIGYTITIAALFAASVNAQHFEPAARREVNGKTYSVITQAVPGPGYGGGLISSTDDSCASGSGITNMLGGTCYRVCVHGLPGTNSIRSTRYLYRLANISHNQQFLNCATLPAGSALQCRALNIEAFPHPDGTASICDTMLLSGKESNKVDLRMDVIVK